jgi:hypothetical protein
VDILAVVDAVVLEMNGVRWSSAFAPERKFQPLLFLKEMPADVLKVIAAPASKDAAASSTRTEAENVLTVDLGLLYKFHPDTAVEVVDQKVGELIVLEQELERFWLRRRLTSNRSVICLGVEISPLYDQAALMESREFRAVVKLSMRWIA